MHIAIKCTYNNGGEGEYVGFNGTCTETNIIRNIEQGRVWCNQEDCDCNIYYKKGFKGLAPKYPCYESELFKNWRYGAGWFHTGVKAGTPIRINDISIGDVVILTTRFPDEDNELNRKIIGLFVVGKIDETEETFLFADKKLRIRLPIDIAKNLYFWDYYKTSTEAVAWGTGLYRYLNNEMASQILKDVAAVSLDERTRSTAQAILVFVVR